MADFLAHEKFFYIPPNLHIPTTGTWTLTNSSGLSYYAKSAADTTTVYHIPIFAPALSGEFGIKIKRIEVPMRIATANLDAVLSGTLRRINSYKAVAAAGVNQDTTAITGTETGTQVTADAADRLYTFTVTSPAYDVSSTITKCHYALDISINAGATTVPWVYGAYVFYEDAS